MDRAAGIALDDALQGAAQGRALIAVDQGVIDGAFLPQGPPGPGPWRERSPARYSPGRFPRPRPGPLRRRRSPGGCQTRDPASWPRAASNRRADRREIAGSWRGKDDGGGQYRSGQRAAPHFIDAANDAGEGGFEGEIGRHRRLAARGGGSGPSSSRAATLCSRRKETRAILRTTSADRRPAAAARTGRSAAGATAAPRAPRRRVARRKRWASNSAKGPAAGKNGDRRRDRSIAPGGFGGSG